MIKDDKFELGFLKKLKKEKLSPRPKWHFLLKDYVVWGLGVLSLFVGALAFSVIIYLFRYNDWEVYEQISDSLLGFILLTLPYFWILLLIIFIVIINYNLKHTKKGYRYPLLAVVSVSILASTVLGIMFFHIGMGQAIDDVLGKKMPFYEKFINPRMGFWCQPEKGRLAGVVIEKSNDKLYLLLDIKKQEWNVDASELKESKTEIKVGRPIKVLGTIISEYNFKALEILEHGPGRGFFNFKKGHYPRKKNQSENSIQTSK